MDSNNINRVEAYFRDELSENEVKQLRADLVENEELKQLFQEYHLAMETVDVQVENELRDQFNEWKTEMDDHKTKQRTLIPQVWKIAASLALITTIAYFIFRVQDKPFTGYELAMEYYELPTTPGSDMGKGEENWSNGLQAYEAQDYSRAIALWTSMKVRTPEQDYYLAHAYFKTGDYSNAVILFQQISNGTSAYSFSADWFLALSYLANDQIENGKSQINKIIQSSGHPYIDDAEKLFKNVENIPVNSEK